MRRARVTGTVTATVKDPGLAGATLLLCQSESAELVAVDTVGAGVGDEVLVAEGSAARLPAQTSGAPIDASIIAIVDTVAQPGGS